MINLKTQDDSALEARAPLRDEAPLLAALRSVGVTFFTGVPDSEFRALISELEASAADGEYALATREDGAVGLAAGAALAGRRPLVFMESAGLGNSLDALTSLAIAYELPLVLLVAWAGYKGQDTPHNNVMGRSLVGILEALDLPVEHLANLKGSTAELARAVKAASLRAVEARRPGVVLGVPAKFADDQSSPAK